MSERPPETASDPLAHVRRRYVLYCLHLYSSPMRLADVAEQVLVWERGGEPADCLRERLRVYNDLHHDHLPALCDAGLVEYDQTDDMVDLGAATPRFEAELERHLSAELGDLLHAEGDAFEGPSPGPFPTGLYRALAAPERRRTLFYLLDRRTSSVEELVDALADWRALADGAVEVEAGARTPEDLREVHLPMLEAVGLVDHDPDAGTVSLRSLTDPVRGVIRSAVSVDRGRPGREPRLGAGHLLEDRVDVE